MSVPLKKRRGIWKNVTQKSGVRPLLLGQSGSGEGNVLTNSRKYGFTHKDCNSVPSIATRGYQTLDRSELNSLQFAKHHIPVTDRNHRGFQLRHSEISEVGLPLSHIIASSDAEKGRLIRETSEQNEMEDRMRMTKSWVNENNHLSTSSEVGSLVTARTSDEIYLHINGRKYIARPVETQEIEDDGPSSKSLTSNNRNARQEHLELSYSTHNSTEHLPRPCVTSNTLSDARDTLSEPTELMKYFQTKESESFEQMILKDKLSVLSHLQQLRGDITPPTIMVGPVDSSGDDVREYEESSASSNTVLRQPYVEESLGTSSFRRRVIPHPSQLSQCYKNQKLHSLSSRMIPDSREALVNSNPTFTLETQGAMDGSLPGCSSISPSSPPLHSLPMSPGSVDTSVPKAMRSVPYSDTDSPDIHSSTSSNESDRHLVTQSTLPSSESYKAIGNSSPYRTLKTSPDSGLVTNPPLKIEENENGSEVLPTVTRPKDNKCPVCGDEVSGYHYGIYSCESCKGFFKRTVQSKRNERLRCARSGNCDMNLRSRKHCAACRFQKCINQGMKLEAIRGNRQRGGRSMYEGSSEYRRRLMLQNQQQKNTLSPNVKKRKRRQNACGGVQKTETWESQVGMQQECQENASIVDIMKSTKDYPEASLLEDLLAHDDILSAQPLASCCQLTGQSEEAIFHSVCHIVNHHLVILYEWTQGLPFFRELETVDQEFLYKRRWIHLMLSHLVLTSPNDPAMVTLRDGSMADLEQCFESTTFCELILRLREIHRYFRSLGLDSTECALLKLLVLLNSDLPGINQPSRVSHFQETVQDMLFQYVLSKESTNYRRVGDILLKFAEIERMCLILYEHIMYKFMAGDLSEFGHLSEVLKNI